MKQLWWFAAALGVAQSAASEEMVKLAPTQLELPARIGPMHIQGEPYHYPPASLGVS